MAQIQGSGAGNSSSTAIVDASLDAQHGRLWVDSFISNTGSNAIPISGVFATINTKSEILRIGAGSPFAWHVFSSLVNSFNIDNLGSNAIYYGFSGTLVPTGSETAFLESNNVISFDLQLGSIMIQSSGNSISEVQLIGVL